MCVCAFWIMSHSHQQQAGKRGSDEQHISVRVARYIYFFIFWDPLNDAHAKHIHTLSTMFGKTMWVPFYQIGLSVTFQVLIAQLYCIWFLSADEWNYSRCKRWKSEHRCRDIQQHKTQLYESSRWILVLFIVFTVWMLGLLWKTGHGWRVERDRAPGVRGARDWPGTGLAKANLPCNIWIYSNLTKHWDNSINLVGEHIYSIRALV